MPHGKDNARTFENFRPREGTEIMVEAAHELVDGRGPRVLVLWGNVGGGKSHILEATGRAILAQGRTVRYDLAGAFVDRLRFTHEHDAKEDLETLMSWYRSRNTLLLDDIGSERATDFAAEKLVEIVEHRITVSGRLAIATNLNRAKMEAKGSFRLASRLFQGNPALNDVRVVNVEAGDYRA